MGLATRAEWTQGHTSPSQSGGVADCSSSRLRHVATAAIGRSPVRRRSQLGRPYSVTMDAALRPPGGLLPEAYRSECGERAVTTQDRYVLDKALSREHPVERVAMLGPKGAGTEPVLCRDG